jgi:glycosyltransferase involved in cell wall biosynthesis
MVAGCPVVAADATALPEVAGGAAVLVDPNAVEAWTVALARLLDDEDERRRLAIAGRARAAGLTATGSARRLVAAYRLATGTS